jgi:hypothetical protein
LVRLHVVEQLAFRKVVDTTFMVGHLVSSDADVKDVDRYFKALRRAQQDIDMEPEIYKHYFLNELLGEISRDGRHPSLRP